MPKNKVTNYRLKSQRWKSSSEIAQVDDCKVGSEQDEDNKSDITSTPDEEDVEREDSRSFSGSADHSTELYGLNETCGSECSSVASGPSSRHYGSSREPSPSQAMCSTCRKLYQRARRMKAPIIDKLLDKDPNSLSCDQWILIKKIKPKKQIATKRLENLRLDQRECGEREFPTCSRPHIFLQRNLRCIKKPLRKRGRKRRRYNTQDSSVAKKQHFQMGNPDRNIGNVSANDCADSSFCSGFGLADCSGPSVGHEAALDQTTKTMPSTVSQESSGFTGKQKAGEKEPKTKTSFRDLLTQFLCNSSVIVRERR